MLDLFSLGVAVGLQQDLNKAREETGEVFNEEQTNESTNAVAAAIESGIEAVESAVVAVADAMVPSYDMMSQVAEMTMAAPTVDLSLPSSSSGSSKKQ